MNSKFIKKKDDDNFIYLYGKTKYKTKYWYIYIGFTSTEIENKTINVT